MFFIRKVNKNCQTGNGKRRFFSTDTRPRQQVASPYGLEDSPQSQVDDESQPECMVSSCMLEPEVQGEEADRSDCHGAEHQSRSRGTDADTVQQEGGEPCQRNSQHPIEVRAGGFDDGGIVGKQPQKSLAAYGIEQGERYGESDTSAEQVAYRLPEFGCVPGADVLACQCLTCVCKTVHDVGEQGEELHQQGIDSQDDIAVGRSPRGEEHRDGHQSQGAQEDVTVHLKETAQCRTLQQVAETEVFA